MEKPAAIMEDLAAAYRRDGYAVLPGMLPSAQLNHVLQEMHQLVLQQLRHHKLVASNAAMPEGLHRDLHSLFTHDIKTYLATLSVFAKLVSLSELYLHENIRKFTQAIGITLPIWQTGPVVHLMAQDLKVPNGYDGFGAHQDWQSQQGPLNAVTLWVPFMDVENGMYTLEVLPGSHKEGLYPMVQKGPIMEVDTPHYSEKDFIRLQVAQGDIVAFSGFTVHRSSTSSDSRLRIAASLRYENAAEAHFIARGYPQAQKRTQIRELITPDFPTSAHMREIYGE